ncbi:hypothetical protein OIU78_012963 [Salix suchowensis]|nr:hypothetical protein OIU78_012963 [Salix suchowensis]
MCFSKLNKAIITSWKPLPQQIQVHCLRCLKHRHQYLISVNPRTQSTRPFQNAFLIHEHQENDLKSLLNPLVSQSNAMSINGFQPCFSPTISTNKNTGTNSNSQSPSMLFKSSFSYQDCKQSGTNYKQCSTEANFSHFQFPDAHLGCVDKIVHPNPHQNNNPSFFEMGCGGNILGFSESASAADTTAHDMSTSIAFNRAGLQMMLDTPIRLPGESWPFDP